MAKIGRPSKLDIKLRERRARRLASFARSRAFRIERAVLFVREVKARVSPIPDIKRPRTERTRERFRAAAARRRQAEGMRLLARDPVAANFLARLEAEKTKGATSASRLGDDEAGAEAGSPAERIEDDEARPTEKTRR